MTKTEEGTIGLLVVAIYDEVAELRNAADVLADAAAALKRLGPIDYAVEDDDSTIIA